MYCLIYCCVSVVTYDTNKAIHSRLSFFDRIADICFLVCGIKVFSKVESVFRFTKIAWCFMYTRYRSIGCTYLSGFVLCHLIDNRFIFKNVSLSIHCSSLCLFLV